MKVRAILFESSSLYLRHWVRLVPPAIALSCCAAIPILVAGSWGFLVAAVLSLPLVYLVQAIHIVDSAEFRTGRTVAGLVDELGSIRKRLKSMFAAIGLSSIMLGLLAAIAVILIEVARENVVALLCSLVTTILLYLFLATRWSMITPIVLLEGVEARRAFRYSQQLVRGHTVRMSMIFVIAQIVPLIAFLLIGYAAGKAVHDDQLSEFLREATYEPLTSAFIAILWTNAYFALRGEGIQPTGETAAHAAA